MESIGGAMSAAEALTDDGVLAKEPCLEFGAAQAVAKVGGFAVLPWRRAWRLAIAAGLAAAPEATGVAVGAYRQAVVHLQKGRAATMVDVATAWSLLEPGGVLLVCGDNDLGITTFVKRLGEDLGQIGEIVANRSHGRIVRFVRDATSTLDVPTGQEVPLMPPGSDDGGADAHLLVTPGVFSGDGLDEGTGILIGCLALLPPPTLLADLGCGAGHLAIASLVRWPRSTAVLADGDQRAVRCAQANLARLGLADRARVVWWDAEEPPPATGCDLILCNPPFHTGVGVDLSPAKAMFRTLLEGLALSGRGLVVANRTLPYERELEVFGRAKTVRQDSRFKVIEVGRG